VRKLKKGYGKYKGKLPFKCFNCGKVGHFLTKCPYAKDESSDDEEYHNVKKGKNIINTKRTTKRTSMKRRRTLISRRRISTQKGLVTHLKKAVKVVSIVIEKKLSLWKSETKIDEDKGIEMMDSKEEENAKNRWGSGS
jgi:hypothetical protein